MSIPPIVPTIAAAVLFVLIVFGGVGCLTWDDMVANRFRFKKYRMQSKAILTATAAPDAPQ